MVHVKLIYRCPKCDTRADWPMSLLGVAEKRFRCVKCGTEGEIADDVLKPLMDLIFKDDVSSHEGDAGKEIALEPSAE